MVPDGLRGARRTGSRMAAPYLDAAGAPPAPSSTSAWQPRHGPAPSLVRSPRPVCLGVQRRRAIRRNQDIRAATTPRAPRQGSARQGRAGSSSAASSAQTPPPSAHRRCSSRQTWDAHPYLQHKALGSRRAGGYGCDGPRGFVLDDALLIPMRSIRTGEVRAVQAIQPNGKSQVSAFRVFSSAECVFTLGPRGRVVWWCESFGTGLAIRRCTRCRLPAIRQGDLLLFVRSTRAAAAAVPQAHQLRRGRCRLVAVPRRPPVGRAGRRLPRMRRTCYATCRRQGRSGYRATVVGARQTGHRWMGLRGPSTGCYVWRELLSVARSTHHKWS